MPIRPKEIDPTIQTALRERLTQIFAAQAHDPQTARIRAAGNQLWRETARRYSGFFWGAGAAFVAAFIAVGSLERTNEGLAVLSFLTLNGGAIWLGVQGFLRTNRELTQYVSADLMRGAASLVALSPAERLYCEAVAELVDTEKTLGEPAQQEMLQQLNELLERHRNLAVPLREFHAASGSSSIAALEQELATLNQRRDALGDPAARGIMQQSSELCSRRLEQARALEPVRQQAEAQQELIVQTLAAVRSSLARTASRPTTEGAHVQALQDSVTQVNRQARAIEEAVAEVVTLGA